jgi:hemolysin III
VRSDIAQDLRVPGVEARAVTLPAAGRLSIDWAEFEFRNYAEDERRFDSAVHAIGLSLGFAGCLQLGYRALPGAAVVEFAALGIYMLGLMAMLGFSALYNLTYDPARKRLFRRLDHAAIFLMIAGTYSPFTLVVIGGSWGVGLFLFVWIAASFGMIMKLTGLRCPEWLSIASYLVLGWAILLALDPLLAAVSGPTLTLLGAGGVLYSIGVVFHLWDRLPYHNAIWHSFVLAAATCHYLAILGETARF